MLPRQAWNRTPISAGGGDLVVDPAAVREDVEWSKTVVQPERASSARPVWVATRIASGVSRAQSG